MVDRPTIWSALLLPADRERTINLDSERVLLGARGDSDSDRCFSWPVCPIPRTRRKRRPIAQITLFAHFVFLLRVELAKTNLILFQQGQHCQEPAARCLVVLSLHRACHVRDRVRYVFSTVPLLRARFFCTAVMSKHPGPAQRRL